MLTCCEISPAIYCLQSGPAPGLSLIWAGGRGWPCKQTTGQKGLDDDLQDSKLIAKCISAIED